jgi:hypothetical protein
MGGFRPSYADSLLSDDEKKSPAHLGGAASYRSISMLTPGRDLLILDARLSYATALLDDHIAVTRTPAHRDVAIAVHAVSVTQRSDAVFPAQPLGACR